MFNPPEELHTNFYQAIQKVKAGLEIIAVDHITEAEKIVFRN